MAKVTSRCDWRIGDLVQAGQPVTLYLVVPPSDIARTKPLVRLLLNQIGRRLTEELEAKQKRHRLLLMLDEFPALGRLDFFESALAFMAGYGLKSFLIAQSLNQIEKAYGANNSILDNCHVRVSFATNDERTAKRVSDALGTATEMKAQRNYAGHRLSPWLGHLMVSRQETARPLLTPGEIMQLPPSDELVLVSGLHPIRASKARFYEDARLKGRVLPPPSVLPLPTREDGVQGSNGDSTVRPRDDWSCDASTTPASRRRRSRPGAPLSLRRKIPTMLVFGESQNCRSTRKSCTRRPHRRANSSSPKRTGRRTRRLVKARLMRRQFGSMARQASLDPDDGIGL